MALSSKESAFVDAFDGNGTAACRKAGYAGNDQTLAVQASRLLRKPKVREAIEERRKKQASATIASRQQRQEFWTKTMQDVGAEMRDRLKASELLGKSEADFIENIRHADPNGDPLTVNIVKYGGGDA